MGEGEVEGESEGNRSRTDDGLDDDGSDGMRPLKLEHLLGRLEHLICVRVVVGVAASAIGVEVGDTELRENLYKLIQWWKGEGEGRGERERNTVPGIEGSAAQRRGSPVRVMAPAVAPW